MIFFKKISRDLILKSLVFVIISILCIIKTNSLTSYPTGDGLEYILTTEALYRHASPDINAKDAVHFKRAFQKVNPWWAFYKPDYFDSYLRFLQNPVKRFKEANAGTFVAKNRKIYSYHFFTYSLSNVPVRIMAQLLKLNPLSTFKITNALLIILTCFIIIFISPFNAVYSCLIAFSFYFSSVYWYLGWAHTEVFTTCLVTLSCWLLMQNYNYWPLFLVSLATTQNQPLLFLTLFMILVVLVRNGLKFRTIIYIACCTFIVVIPSIFYYYHFHTFNLIKDEGFLDPKNQTYTRISGFFFDLNQGMVLAIPMILFGYIGLIIYELGVSIKRRITPRIDLLIPLVVLAITFTVSMMSNWNHGQAVVSRYASWTSAIIMIHFFYLVKNFSRVVVGVLFGLTMITQLATTLYHEDFNTFDWQCITHKPLAKWVLQHHPAWYTPDPGIFGCRTIHTYDLSPDYSPIFFFNNNKEITKLMCYQPKADDLLAYGIAHITVNQIKKKRDINNWVYLNRGEFELAWSEQAIFNKVALRLSKLFIVRELSANPEKYNSIVVSAKERNLSPDSALVIEAVKIFKEREGFQ